jgi:hypothetical protein
MMNQTTRHSLFLTPVPFTSPVMVFASSQPPPLPKKGLQLVILLLHGMTGIQAPCTKRVPTSLISPFRMKKKKLQPFQMSLERSLQNGIQPQYILSPIVSYDDLH